MFIMKGVAALLLVAVAQVEALGATDTITWGGSNMRHSYETTHNMDPVVVASSQFGQLFEINLPGNYGGQPEGIYSQPLVYTPNGGDTQYVYWATTQNNVYKMNAKTGEIVLSRNLHIPFLQADLDGCTDISPHIGITGTGVIDPDTETLYLTAKTYEDQNITTAQGRPAGRYYIHALDVNDLSERPNFPVGLEGLVPRNSPTRSFNGGIQLQRPGLLHAGQYIYAGFGSHCVQYNFTGWLIGWDKTTGEIVEHWATEGEGVDNSLSGGSLWMSGGGIASDDNGSIYFATGNGYASQLSTIPVNGHNPPTAIEEAAVHMTINDDGSVTFVDFFMPWNKQELDGDDKDLGVTPLTMLPSEFACGEYKSIGVVTDKFGLTYFLDLDNLGGYRNGAGGLDAVIGSYQNEDAVYSGAGVYPGEGGWIYITVVGYPTHAFQFSCDSGVPSFTHVAKSAESAAQIRGVGHGTVTSLEGQEGTGLLWVSDVRAPQLRIYNAIPSGGSLELVKSFTADGVTKFTHPVFGDGIVYLGTTQGRVFAFGAPVTEPLNCTSPIDFGNASIGSAAETVTVTCTAVIGVTVTDVSLNSTEFSVSGLPTLPLALTAGKTFAFQAKFAPTTVGSLSGQVKIDTTNNAADYSIVTVVRLTGDGESEFPLLQVSPTNLTWSAVYTGQFAGGVNETFILSNVGNSVLTVSGYEVSESGAEGTFVSGTKIGKFSFYNLPSTIAANSADTITANFDSSDNGTFTGYLRVNSDGGSVTLETYAHSGGPPKALVQFLSPDGLSWVDFVEGQNFTFGNVTENTTRNLKLRITNSAPAGSNDLTLTVSKPPFGLTNSIIQAVNEIDLGEGTTISAGESQNATLYCTVPKSQWDVDAYTQYASWTINANDDTLGKHTFIFACTAVSEQAPPLDSGGEALYRYVGCYKENNPGRQLSKQLYSNANNTNAMCIAACAEGQYTFCGTQYEVECWAGNAIPVQEVDDADCNYACGGDLNQICGGNGVGTDAGGAFISLFANKNGFSGGGGSTTPPAGPVVNPGIDGYVSLGCYKEPDNGRALRYQFTTSNHSVESCLSYCAGTYTYAGLEYGGECWCDNVLASGANLTSASDCSMTCNDNSTEYCGAGSRLNLYQMGGTPVASTSSAAASSSASTGTKAVSSSALASSATSSATSTKVSSSSFVALTTSSSAVSSSTFKAVSSSSTAVSSSKISSSSYSTAASSSVVSSSSATSSTSKISSSSTVSSTSSSVAASTSSAMSTSSTATSSSVVSSSKLVSSSASATSSKPSSSSSSKPVLSSSVATTSSTWSSSALSSSVASSSIKASSSSVSSSSKASSSAIPSSSAASSSLGSSSTKTSSSIVSSSTSSSAPSSSTAAPTIITSSSSSQSSSSVQVSSSIVSSSAVDTSSSAVSSSTSSAVSSSSSAIVPSTTKPSSSSAIVSSSATSSLVSTTSSTATSSTTTSSSAVSSTSSAASSSSSTPASSTAASSTATSPTAASSSSSALSSSSSSTTSSSVAVSSSSSAVYTTFTTKTSSSSTTSSSTSHTPTPTGPFVNPGVAGYLSLGCYTEATSGRALQYRQSVTNQTVANCLNTCAGKYLYAGVEYGGECWCGNNIGIGAQAAASSDCSMTCNGNRTEYCGGSNRLNLYEMGSTEIVGGPYINPGLDGYQYKGCYKEPATGRALQYQQTVSTQTVAECLNTCAGRYTYAGLEYGGECWCGNTLNGANLTVDTDCSMTCNGNSTEYCGASLRLDLYMQS